MRIISSLALLLGIFPLSAQRVVVVPPIERGGVTHVSSLNPEDDFYPAVYYTEVKDGINREKDRLSQAKSEVGRRFPKKNIGKKNDLRDGPPPHIIDAFQGFTSNLGIPLDNHIAVSNDGFVVAVANFHVAIYRDNVLLARPSLIAFTRSLDLPKVRFDPRIMYDPVEDRFVIAMLHGTERDETKIILAFSQTNDPTGDWNLYKLDGNPFGLTIFSDFPMLSLTQEHLYLTINAVDDELSWQEGFVESYIWEIPKSQGFAGDSLTTNLITNVQWEGKNIRNLCPVSSGDENLPDTPYFLSNRNFDVQNDTVFLVGYQDRTITVRPIVMDVAYGVPPNAHQKTGTLQTNDARILDAFIQQGHIQFVGNTVDTSTGLASLYHGVIEDVHTSIVGKGGIISNGEDELGYPDISYVGITPYEKRSIITANHVSAERFPGKSALEYDGIGYSPIITLREGDNIIDQLSSDLERWGDYSGNQRIYNEPGLCWTVGMFGRSDREYGIWITKLASSDSDVSSEDQPLVQDAILWPNPSSESIDIEFNPSKGKHISLSIYDMEGKKVHVLPGFTARKEGRVKYTFSLSPLRAGTYVCVAEGTEGIYFSKSFVKK